MRFESHRQNQLSDCMSFSRDEEPINPNIYGAPLAPGPEWFANPTSGVIFFPIFCGPFQSMEKIFALVHTEKFIHQSQTQAERRFEGLALHSSTRPFVTGGDVCTLATCQGSYYRF